MGLLSKTAWVPKLLQVSLPAISNVRLDLCRAQLGSHQYSIIGLGYLNIYALQL